MSAEQSKGRRLQRACDACRRKKIRCSASETGDTVNPCTSCKNNKQACRFEEAAKKRGPPKGYVEQLERRVQAMEQLLESLGANTGANSTADSPEDDFSGMHSSTADLSQHYYSTDTVDGQLLSRSPSPDEADLNDAAGRLNGLSLSDGTYIGRSAEITFARSTLTAFRNITCEDVTKVESTPSHLALAVETAQGYYRTLFPLPPQDLCRSLIDLYFSEFNSHTLLLHRSSFERDYANRDSISPSFIALVFMVLAIGSRFSDDPRIYESFGYLGPPSLGMGGLEQNEVFANVPPESAGYAFQMAAMKLTTQPMQNPTIYDLQSSVLTTIYMMEATSPLRTWSALGFFVHRALEVGAHRQKIKQWNKSLLQDELRKRCFWALYCLDRQLSGNLGRPVCISDDDIDLDLPAELTDEELDHYEALNLPYPRHFGPPQKAVPVSAFCSFIRMQKITSRALKDLYGSHGPGVSPQQIMAREKAAVVALDAALNDWLNNLPNHLRWKPPAGDPIALIQSAAVLCSYYAAQILVHRGFLSPERQGIIGFPSLAICLNAARSLSRVVEAVTNAGVIHKMLAFAPFWCCTASMVLVINVFGNNKVSGPSEAALLDVQRCFQGLKILSRRSYIAKIAHNGFAELFPGQNEPGKDKLSMRKSSKRDREETNDPSLRPAPAPPMAHSSLFDYPSIVQQHSGESSPDSVFSHTDRTLPINTADLSGFNNFSSNSAFQPFSFSAPPEPSLNDFIPPPSSFDLPFFTNSFDRPLFENSDGTPLFSPYGAYDAPNGDTFEQSNFDFNVPALPNSMYSQHFSHDQRRGSMQQW